MRTTLGNEYANAFNHSYLEQIANWAETARDALNREAREVASVSKPLAHMPYAADARTFSDLASIIREILSN